MCAPEAVTGGHARSGTGPALGSLLGNAPPSPPRLLLLGALQALAMQGWLTGTCVASQAAMCSATVMGSIHLCTQKRKPPAHTLSHKASKAIIKSRRSRVTWSHEAHCDGRALHLKISTTGASGTQASRAKRSFSFCIIITRHACPSNGNLHALMNASRRQAVAHGLDRLAGSLEQLCCAHGRLWSAPQLERQRHPRLTSIALQAT